MKKGYDARDPRRRQQTGDVGDAVLAPPATFSCKRRRRALRGSGVVWWIGAAVLVLVLGACSGGDQAPTGQSVVTGTAPAADGTPISYRDYGGAGPALVLLTGLGNSAAVYDDFAPRFTDEHRVVAITRRGFADSGKPGTGYDQATRASDDLAVLDALDIEDAAFVGHSVAGSELAQLGTRHGDRVTGLVFLDATSGPRSAEQKSAVDDCISFSESWMPAMVVSDDRLGDEVAHAQAQNCADLMGDLAEESAAAAAQNKQIQTQIWQDAHHHLFLPSPQQTEDAIETWLAGLQP